MDNLPIINAKKVHLERPNVQQYRRLKQIKKRLLIKRTNALSGKDGVYFPIAMREN